MKFDIFDFTKPLNLYNEFKNLHEKKNHYKFITSYIIFIRQLKYISYLYHLRRQIKHI